MAEKTYRFYIRQGEFELDLEGDQDFVESYLEAFLEGEAALTRGAASPPAGRGSKPGKGQRASTGQAEKAKKAVAAAPPVDAAVLAAYMKGRRPKNHKERILRYFGFLTSTGVREWGAAHLMACYSAAGARFPAAGRQYFQILKKQGLVEKSGTWGLWKLTAKGAVEAEALGGPAKAPKARAPRRARTPKRAKAAPAKVTPQAKVAPKAKRAKKGNRKAVKKIAKAPAPKAGAPAA